MSIAHVLSGQPVSVAPFGASLPEQRTVALFKSDQLEAMRLVLPAGKSMPMHRVAGEVTIQCLEGTLELQLDGDTVPLQAGELVYLRADEPHAVSARSDASALVTLVLARSGA